MAYTIDMTKVYPFGSRLAEEIRPVFRMLHEMRKVKIPNPDFRLRHKLSQTRQSNRSVKRPYYIQPLTQ